MNYAKPEIVVLGDATLVIRGNKVSLAESHRNLKKTPTDSELDD